MQDKSVFRWLSPVYAVLCMISFTVQADFPTSHFQVDINSRETVRNFYRTVFNASNDIPVNWAGDISACNAGDSSQQHKYATLRRINYFRAMAGVPAWVTFTASANSQARSAALLASANNALSHYPSASWICYSTFAAQSSASSNIALGETGPDAITAYIKDFGEHNLSVGHRRWLLYPQTRIMGTGDISPQGRYGQNASAILVFDDQYGRARPQTRHEYVSWPPAGFVPYQLVYPRWSFSLPNADFSQASVSVTRNQQHLAVEVFPVENGFGEATLVWEIKQADLIKPVRDLVYQISISNVLVNGSVRKNYTYQVKVFDPAVEGEDTLISTISGADQITTGQRVQYTVKALPGVNSYQVLRAQRSPDQSIATAENGLEQLQASRPDQVISDFTSNSGRYSYYLSHSTGISQTLSFDKQYLVYTDSTLEFNSKINCAMPDESANVQVSLDDGASWQDVYQQTGIRFGLREADFKTHAINLGVYAGNIIRIRFNYRFKSGWRCSTANSGWYLDDIVFNHVDALNNAQLTTITHQSFQFTPTQATNYILAARGVLFNGFNGQWGTAFPVQVLPKVQQPSAIPDSNPSQTVNTPVTGNTHLIIFKSSDDSIRRCEYTKATLDTFGQLKLTIADVSCLRNPE